MVSEEYESRRVERASRKTSNPKSLIKCKDIFQPLPGKDHAPVRTVLMNGVAGIEKTVFKKRYILDWAEGKANHNIQFIFPFSFRELNLLSENEYSLVELIHLFFPETKDAGIFSFEDFKVVFIFDGLDKCRLPLNFYNNKILTDATKPTTLDVVLTNLITGNLLPKAHLWITTRPATVTQIPPECVDIVTEVRGFNDTQKKEYFMKRFREDQAQRIITHIESSCSLRIMCHIPVFCWITASVLETKLREHENGELPETLTEMYIHYLIVQSKIWNENYHGADTDTLWNTQTCNIIMSLGRLAFEQLQQGKFVFYQSDLTASDVDVKKASVYSGLFTQIFKEEFGLYQNKVFRFIHRSVQEFLAALYVYVTFMNMGVNLLSEPQPRVWWWPNLLTYGSSEKSIFQAAVDKALQSPTGHLDTFLRFLLGFSLETNQNLLQGLLEKKECASNVNDMTRQYIKEKIQNNPSSERCKNLFHCLNELNDDALVEEVQECLNGDSNVGKAAIN